MDALMKAAAAAVTGAVLALLLKKHSPETALVLSLAAAVTAVLLALPAVRAAVEFIDELADAAGLEPAVLAAVLKSVGIAVVTRLAADVCRDAGQSASASAVELCGAAGALYVAIPLMKTVLKMVEGLL
ncbi:MAG: stage III sporulation protein AD [Oscillospiraceae bacterium]|nr:stage III sporulation protein AD [Oscillospiraceae bacterium]